MNAPDAPEDMRVTRVAGTGVAVRGDDIDTDQIIPARFLKSTTWEGLDEYAFYDSRRDDDGAVTGDHPFDRPEHQGASILVVNENFGCGSSREHAPRALRRWGVEAIVGESFAEIFADNCKSLGMVAAEADPDVVAELQSLVEADPDAGLEVDVAEERVVFDGREVDVAIDEAMREALVQGVWDTTTLMRDALDETRTVARGLPYVEEVE
jgi:3-isopropylmalate/(R)-2-methylmalate dehydratase small subunit